MHDALGNSAVRVGGPRLCQVHSAHWRAMAGARMLGRRKPQPIREITVKAPCPHSSLPVRTASRHVSSSRPNNLPPCANGWNGRASRLLGTPGPLFSDQSRWSPSVRTRFAPARIGPLSPRPPCPHTAGKRPRPRAFGAVSDHEGKLSAEILARHHGMNRLRAKQGATLQCAGRSFMADCAAPAPLL